VKIDTMASPANLPAENTNTPRLDALCLLDSYVSSHRIASANMKAALWDLSRARRSSGGFHLGGGGSAGLSALDVREELRARAVLKCRTVRGGDDDPVEESNDGSDTLFEFFPDGISFKNVDEASGSPRAVSGLANSTGLRQRKNAPKEAEREEKSLWTEDPPELDEEEERLRKTDPIDLFGGLPPPALRKAQAEARKALEAYVEAANCAAVILRIAEDLKEVKPKS